ncbi:hypothetical protein ACFV3E_40800 [Streptomyces sp. NPDC059718]
MPENSAPALLRQGNSDLRRDRIWTWTLPAWVVKLPSGRHINVCPSADICAKLCYARTGTYRYRNVREAHMRNLLLTLEDLSGFEQMMTAELRHRRYAKGATVRLHDAGDFYSADYLRCWLRIMRTAPHVRFYCYTKEVALFREFVEPDPPPNFGWCFSFGGRRDHLIDVDHDRHADVFPDEDALTAAGYFSQSASDLLAVTGPPRVGIPANRIPHLVKMQGRQSFGELQRDRDEWRARRRRAPIPAADYSPLAPSLRA